MEFSVSDRLFSLPALYPGLLEWLQPVVLSMQSPDHQAAGSPGNLLEMQSLRPYLQSTEPETEVENPQSVLTSVFGDSRMGKISRSLAK